MLMPKGPLAFTEVCMPLGGIPQPVNVKSACSSLADALLAIDCAFGWSTCFLVGHTVYFFCWSLCCKDSGGQNIHDLPYAVPFG